MSEQLPNNPVLNERFVKAMETRAAIEQSEFEDRQAEKKAQSESREFRKKTRMANESFEWDQLAKHQGYCDHRKGTQGRGPKAKHIDYDVSRHRFASGIEQIKCLKCKMKWYPGDTKELCSYSMDVYASKGRLKKRANPTKLSYAEAYALTLEDNTTNKPTTAEMILQNPVATAAV